MKYRFLLLSSLLASASVFAQSSYTTKVKATAETSKQLTVAEPGVSSNEGTSYTSNILSEDLGPVLMYEDFVAGLPAGWTNTSLAGNNAIWEYRGPSTTPANTVGSQGAYANANDPIESTTAGNGFMIFDSDWWDNGGSPTGTGQQAPPHQGEVTSGLIDCSAEPNVLLTFETYLRNYQSFFYVIVTNDGFTNNQDTVWNGADDYAVNAASPTDLFVKRDISDIAGNSASLQVRFVYESNPAAALPGYYFWMIDDVTVSGAADFDLELEEVFFKGFTGSDEDFQYTNFYTEIPVKQMAGTNLEFGGAIRNNSAAGSNNTMLNADVSGAETFSASSPAVTYTTFGEPDSVVVSSTYVPATVGSYTVDFEVMADSADDFSSDNAAQRTFGVSERTYAWGNGSVDDGVSWSSGTQSMYMRYDVFDPSDSISAVEFALWSSSTFESTDGSIVLVGVWPVTGGTLAGTGEVDFNSPIASKYVTLASSDFNDLVKVTFDQPAGFPAGVTEVVAGYTYQSGTIRTANSDLPYSPLNAYVDTDSDGQIDGWVDMVPVIQMETYSATICQNTNIIVDAGVDCDMANYEATIDAFAVGGNGAYAWSWSNGASTEDITVIEEGTYVATAQDEDFCVGTATFEITNASFNCNLAINELAGETFNFSVQPNPSNGIFNLSFEALNAERVAIEIQSIKGDVVFNKSFDISNGSLENVNLSNLSSGVYIMKASGASNAVTKRIIIQ